MAKTQTNQPRRRTARAQTRQQIQKTQCWLSRYRSSYNAMDAALFHLQVQIQLIDGLTPSDRDHLLGAARCAHAEFTHAWSRMEHERLRWYARKRN